jgi:hypothetical protein
VRVALVGRVEHAPRAGAAHDGGLLVVDPHRGGHPVEPSERFVVARQPRQQVLAGAPHDDVPARVAQHHAERQQVDLATAQEHRREVRPVGLGLRSRRRLDPPAGAHLRLRERLAHEPLQAPQAARVLVLGHQVRMEVGYVARHAFAGARQVRVDRAAETGRGAPLVRAAVQGIECLAAQVVADVAFADAQQAGDLPVRDTPFGEVHERHDVLPVELRHPMRLQDAS